MRKGRFGFECRLIFRAGAALVLAGVMSSANALTPDRFFAKAAPSVWRVFAYDAKGAPLTIGSAVVIAKETLITNCHVVSKSSYITIKQDNVSYQARIQYIDPERDL